MLHQSCFIISYNSPGVTQSKGMLHNTNKLPLSILELRQMQSGEREDTAFKKKRGGVWGEKALTFFLIDVYLPDTNNTIRALETGRHFITSSCHLHILVKTHPNLSSAFVYMKPMKSNSAETAAVLANTPVHPHFLQFSRSCFSR